MSYPTPSSFMPFIAAILLVACTSPTADTSTVQQAPPGALHLSLPYFTAGTQAEVQITGAQAFEEIEIAFGTRGTGSGPCPTSYGGACLGLVGGRTLATVFADAAGNASWSVTPPVSAIGVDVCMQAVVVRGPGGANTEISSPACQSIQQTCGLTSWTADFSGYAPGTYGVIRVPNATITGRPGALVVNADGSLGVEGGSSDTTLDGDEDILVLFDRDTLDVGVQMTSNEFVNVKLYGERDAIIYSVGAGVGAMDTIGVNRIGEERVSAMSFSMAGRGPAQVQGLTGVVDTCPCTSRARFVALAQPGTIRLEEMLFGGMALTSEADLVVESGGSLGVGADSHPYLNPDETYLISFAPPAELDQLYFGSGPGTGDLEAWGADGSYLGTRVTDAPGPVDVSALFGSSALTAVRLTGITGAIGTRSIRRTQCR